VSRAVIQQDLIEHRVIDDLVNLSDHLPIIISLRYHKCTPLFETGCHNDQQPIAEQKNSKRLRWDHADLSNYYSLTYTSLQPVMSDIDEFYSSVNKITNYSYGDQVCRRAQISTVDPML